MQFNTYLFVLLFLPVTVGLYFLAGKRSHRAALGVLMLASLVFYSDSGLPCMALLLLSLTANGLLSFLMGKHRSRSKIFLTVGIVFNVFLLLYFKYANFFLDNFNLLTGASFHLEHLVLPLGISFFTFQQISFLIYTHENQEENWNLFEYLLYILYFPKLIMGPLAEPKELISQFRDPSIGKPNWDHLMDGLCMFSLGLFKKVVLADLLVKAVDFGFGDLAARSSLELWILMLTYTLQIYFDFSGYTDMAIGISRMLNIRLPLNFNSPYQAVSVGDFWKRWHMSLTGFFRSHLYFPLGGSRCGRGKTYRNIMIIFLVSGLWHGANWTFLLWGFLYGLLQIFERMLGKKLDRIPKLLRWSVTFLIVNLLWLLFRSPSVSLWLQALGRMFSFGSTKLSPAFLACFQPLEVEAVFGMIHSLEAYAWVVMAGMLLCSLGLCLFAKNNQKRAFQRTVPALLLQTVVFLYAIMSMGGETSFVYFGF